jgi:hypothetical protein
MEVASTSDIDADRDSPSFKDQTTENIPIYNNAPTTINAPKSTNVTNATNTSNTKNKKKKSKATKNKMYQKKWNETIENLRKNVCPQCGKQRNKLVMQETYLDYILDDDTLVEEGLQGDVSIIACKKCWEAIRHTQDTAQLEHKDVDIKMRDKDIKILRLKLDFYSDSEGDVYSEDESEDSEREESSSDDEDSEERTDGKERGRTLDKKQLNHSDETEAETKKETKNETQKEKEDRVFNFKNLKLNLKKKK